MVGSQKLLWLSWFVTLPRTQHFRQVWSGSRITWSYRLLLTDRHKGWVHAQAPASLEAVPCIMKVQSIYCTQRPQSPSGSTPVELPVHWHSTRRCHHYTVNKKLAPEKNSTSRLEDQIKRIVEHPLRQNWKKNWAIGDPCHTKKKLWGKLQQKTFPSERKLLWFDSTG